MHEFEFNQNKSTSRVIDHKPLGYKAKAPAIDPKVVRVEAKGANEKRVQAQAKEQNLPAPAKKARPDNGRKPAQDADVALCFGDLLNHYGASQQIAFTKIYPKTSRRQPFSKSSKSLRHGMPSRTRQSPS